MSDDDSFDAVVRLFCLNCHSLVLYWYNVFERLRYFGHYCTYGAHESNYKINLQM